MTNSAILFSSFNSFKASHKWNDIARLRHLSERFYCQQCGMALLILALLIFCHWQYKILYFRIITKVWKLLLENGSSYIHYHTQIPVKFGFFASHKRLKHCKVFGTSSNKNKIWIFAWWVPCAHSKVTEHRLTAKKLEESSTVGKLFKCHFYMILISGVQQKLALKFANRWINSSSNSCLACFWSLSTQFRVKKLVHW